jgi:hypothetical protein
MIMDWFILKLNNSYGIKIKDFFLNTLIIFENEKLNWFLKNILIQMYWMSENQFYKRRKKY